MTSRSTQTSARGIGIEFCEHVLRAVVFGDVGAQPLSTAEVSLSSVDDERAVLDSLIRLRAELGGPSLPTRVATFPPGSFLRRVDVTGKTGPELNALRAEIDRRHGAPSTMLVDDGPRRWMHVLHWPINRVRRIEELAERAGFVDAAVPVGRNVLAPVRDGSAHHRPTPRRRPGRPGRRAAPVGVHLLGGRTVSAARPRAHTTQVSSSSGPPSLNSRPTPTTQMTWLTRMTWLTAVPRLRAGSWCTSWWPRRSWPGRQICPGPCAASVWSTPTPFDTSRRTPPGSGC